LLAQIDEALVGLKPGEEAEAEVEMPAQHPNPQMKGKKAVFKLKLNEIKERVLPELDDEFAKDLGEYDDLEGLKGSLRQQLKKQLEAQAEGTLAEELVKQLVEKNPIDLPPALVKQQLQASERELMQQARAAGQAPGALPPEVRAQLQKDSEMKVRAGLLMAQIAKAEGIKIGDKELEEGMKELAADSGKNIAKVKAEYRDPKKREMLIGMILEDKVLDIIQSKAKIEDS
jgi:trigger factor